MKKINIGFNDTVVMNLVLEIVLNIRFLQFKTLVIGFITMTIKGNKLLSLRARIYWDVKILHKTYNRLP